MSSQVLILSPRDDPHALAVSAVLRKDFDTEAVLWDTSNFPVDDRITFEIGNSSSIASIRSKQRVFRRNRSEALGGDDLQDTVWIPQ